MDVNDSLRNTEMCIDYDPQLCYKTNTVSCVNKERSVYKKLSCNVALKACAAATAAAAGGAAAAAAAIVHSLSWEPTVMLPGLEANDICDNSTSISTYSDSVVPVCEEFASISIFLEPIASVVCEVTSTCSNVSDGYKLVSQRYHSPSEVDSAAADVAAAAAGGGVCRLTRHPPLHLPCHAPSVLLLPILPPISSPSI